MKVMDSRAYRFSSINERRAAAISFLRAVSIPGYARSSFQSASTIA
jgi:hypothetical protein